MIEDHSRKGHAMFTGRIFAIWTLLAVMAAVAGPFGTYETTAFGERLAYWAMVVVSSSAVGRVTHILVKTYLGEHRAVLADAVSFVIITIAYTPVLWFVTDSLFKMWSLDGPPSLALLMLYVAVITASVLAFRRLIPELEKVSYVGDTSDRETAAGPGGPRLARRMPDDFAGPILRLTGNDHFVDVVTAAATHSIRLRFGDAISEMDTVPGFCTHRSHWVAQEAIAAVDKSNGKIRLQLSNGDRVPVSRKYKPDLESAGVL